MSDNRISKRSASPPTARPAKSLKTELASAQPLHPSQETVPAAASAPVPTTKAVPTAPRPTPIAIPFGSGRGYKTALKPIPTGPKSSNPGSRYAEPAHLDQTQHHNQSQHLQSQSSSIPTGPRSYNNVEPRRPDSQSQPRAPRSPSSQIDDDDSGMPPKARGTGRGGSYGLRRPTPPAKSKQTVQLSAPLQDSQYIIATYGKGVALKPQWAENPKAPLANYLGAGSGGGAPAEFDVQEGMIGNKKVFR